MKENYLPQNIQERVDGLLEETGVPATVTRTGTTYILEHGNERVHLVCRYVRNSRGKFSYSSTLTVDGKPRPLVDGPVAYSRILADPDDEHPNRKPGRELPPVHPLEEGAEVPALVASMAELSRTPDNHVSVEVGHCSVAQRKRWDAWTWALNDQDAVPDPDAYVVEIVKENGDRVQMHFQPHPKMSEVYYISGVSGVDGKGRDLMGEIGKDIDKAVAVLLGVKIPPQPGGDKSPDRLTGDSKGAVSNSVTVRKATDFRI